MDILWLESYFAVFQIKLSVEPLKNETLRFFSARIRNIYLLAKTKAEGDYAIVKNIVSQGNVYIHRKGLSKPSE